MMILFILLSVFAIAGAVGMISFYQPIRSALCFILTIISLAGLYALLNASFLFAVQLIVYAGAVITLILFIIMFLNIKDENLPKEKGRFVTMISGAFFLIPLNLVIFRAFEDLDDRELNLLQGDFGSVKAVGAKLFSGWVLPFELISILLLVALIGAIILALRIRK